MPDYEYVHREMQKSGVTLNLLWLEYCEACRTADELPYQLTQFKKYYRDYTAKTNATMHLNHKPGEIMQVDWAGDTASVIDSNTGEVIPAYVFVSSLPYSGYAYVEAFFSMSQENLILGIPARSSTRFSILFTLPGEMGPPLGKGNTYWSLVFCFWSLRTSTAYGEILTAR